MKKITLSAAFVLLLSAIAFVGCSEDNTPLDTESASAAASNPSSSMFMRGSLWAGEVGQYDELTNTYIITGDKEGYKEAFMFVLRDQGYEDVVIESLEILEKTSFNYPDDKGYMLVASDNKGTSIGVNLDRRSLSFVMEDPNAVSYTTCRGCATGCNLQFITVNGKKVPFCNENGCVYDCEKSETAG